MMVVFMAGYIIHEITTCIVTCVKCSGRDQRVCVCLLSVQEVSFELPPYTTLTG